MNSTLTDALEAACDRYLDDCSTARFDADLEDAEERDSWGCGAAEEMDLG